MLRVLTAGPTRPGDERVIDRYHFLEKQRQVYAEWVTVVEAKQRILFSIGFLLVASCIGVTALLTLVMLG